jgi:hypothetical protein
MGRHGRAAQGEMALGKLVPFEKRPVRKPAAEATARPGQVVLFTGVRYARNVPEDDKPPASTTSKRKRG